jgi:nitrogen fixation protein FixH/copper chaperone CopZ
MTAASPPAKPITGWHVLIAIVVFFAVVIGVDTFFMIKAYGTFSGQVASNPYEAGLAFNQTLALRQREAALGWSASVLKVDEDTVVVRLVDRAGAALDRLSLTGALERPATETGRQVSISSRWAMAATRRAGVSTGLGTCAPPRATAVTSSSWKPAWWTLSMSASLTLERDLEAFVRRDEAGRGRLELLVTGARCAACIRKIETAVAGLPGVTGARLNLTTGKLAVELAGNEAHPERVVETVEGLGYRACLFDPAEAVSAIDREGRELAVALGVQASGPATS